MSMRAPFMILNLQLFEREKVYFAHYTHHTHNQITLHAEKGALCLHDLMLNYSEPAESWILKFFDKYVCNTQGSLMFAAAQKVQQPLKIIPSGALLLQWPSTLIYGGSPMTARGASVMSLQPALYLLICQYWPDGALELS
jgi:hypothetical protein